MAGGALLAAALSAASGSADTRWSGWASLEGRAFVLTPLHEDQHGNNLSVAAMPEFYRNWSGGRQAFTVSVLGRLDQGDPDRTHVDLREGVWRYSADVWELRAGVTRVFWGVTESVHLVDIVNSTDLVEGPDGEEKLGQPMVDFTWLPSPGGVYLGSIDVFALPYFRQPTYAGPRGRPRTPYPIDRDNAEFDARNDERSVSFAARWANSVGPIDYGLSYFTGTSRAARFSVGTTAGGDSVLIPRYDLIGQTGLELQGTFGGWLLKFEGFTRSGQGPRFVSLAAGFEYTFPAAFGTGADIGVLSEYTYDERGKTFENPLDNDVFVGSRIAFNNVSGSDLLLGIVVDADNGTNALFAEGSTRIGSALVIEIEARASAGADEYDPLYWFRRDAYVETTFVRYF